MGNKIINKKVNKSQTSPNTKQLKKMKKVGLNRISCLSKTKNKNDDYFISLGLYNGGIELYDINNLDLVAQNYNSINKFEILEYICYLSDNNFLVNGSYIYIFTIYKNKNFKPKKSKSSGLELMYNIGLIQKINYPEKNTYYLNFSYPFDDLSIVKSFIFDRNKNRKNNIYEEILDINEEELIVNGDLGIIIFTRNKENIISDNENNKDEGKNREINFDLDSYIKKWEKNPYCYKRHLSSLCHYDMEQVNYKYIASAVDKYVLLYSMEEYELITKFEVKTSVDCYKIMYMLTDDLLCIGGDDSITLISIKDFEISLVSTIKPNYKITEICILPNYNIIIGIQNKDKDIKREEYLYQYKYYSKVNEMTKKVEHNIYQIYTELLTNNNSNLTMECINNSLVTIVDQEYILLWDLFC